MTLKLSWTYRQQTAILSFCKEGTVNILASLRDSTKITRELTNERKFSWPFCSVWFLVEVNI